MIRSQPPDNSVNHASEILSQCLSAIEAGTATVEGCIARFPDDPELAQLLRTMMVVQGLPRPILPKADKALMRQQMLAKYRTQQTTATPARHDGAFRVPRWALFALGIAAIILFFGGIGSIPVVSPPATEAAASATPTNTATPTRTLSATPTRTPSETSTPSQVPSETLTPSVTPSATSTPTETPSPTDINTPTGEPTLEPVSQATSSRKPIKTSPTPGVGNNNSNSNGGQGNDNNGNGSGNGNGNSGGNGNGNSGGKGSSKK
jgi:uncharacterized membrane protein YgcG